MRAIGHPVVFVLAYIVLLIPTYVLPWLGSNSAALNTTLAAGDGPLNVALVLHAAALLLLVVLTGIRGSVIQKQWILVLPVVAAAFDLLPALSLVPFVPTVLHVAAIILGVALAPRPAASEAKTP